MAEKPVRGKGTSRAYQGMKALCPVCREPVRGFEEYRTESHPPGWQVLYIHLSCDTQPKEATEMAQKVQVLLTDDLDGSEASETVPWSLDGTSYEIDLNDKNAAKLRKALEPWQSASRKAPRNAPQGRSKARSNGSGYDAKAVRAWANSNGHTVPERGRIPGAVLAAFQQAGN